MRVLEQFETLLVVTPEQDEVGRLREMLRSRRWQIESAPTCREAARSIPRLRPRVILCEQSLPDGDWHDLLDAVDHEGRQTRLIVASRLADDALWAEVLNLGGYDVLQEPFDYEEVRRVIDTCHPEQ